MQNTESIKHSFASFILVLLTIFPGTHLPAQAQEATSKNGTLRVLGVREMSQEEYDRRIVDYIGATHSVRFRYEAPIDHGIYIFVLDGMRPEGYHFVRTGPTVRCLSSKGDSHSPGFKKLEEELGGTWLFLPAQSAIEWEVETEPTSAGEEFASSFFVRKKSGDAAIEFISPWFVSVERPYSEGVAN